MQQGRHRDEPGLGDLAGFDAERRPEPAFPIDADHRRRSAPVRKRRRGGGGVVIAGVVIAAAVLLAVIFREPLQRLVSGSETAQAVESALAAEQAGRWYHDAQGNDALSIYRRILADNADNDPAREGLRRVAERLASDAGAAIDAGQYEAVPPLLDELEALGESGDRVADLRRRLEVARGADREIEAMLSRAQQALTANRIRGENGALAEYQRMLARDPGNAVAQRGVDESLAALAKQARLDLAAGNLDKANELVDAIAGHSAQHVDLPALRQELAQARTRLEAANAEKQLQAKADAIARDFAAAEKAAAAGNPVEAASAYRKVLAIDNSHAGARRGLEAVGRQLLDQAEQAIADSNLPLAQSLLASARQSRADADRLARLASRTADLEERLTAVLAKPELSAEEQRRLTRLLERAVSADRAGRLVEPAGDSAYDLYRQVLAIDPTQDAARQAVSALPRRAQTLAAHHIELGQWQQASEAIDALQAMAPLDPSLPELRSQLAAERARR